MKPDARTEPPAHAGSVEPPGGGLRKGAQTPSRQKVPQAMQNLEAKTTFHTFQLRTVRWAKSRTDGSFSLEELGSGSGTGGALARRRGYPRHWLLGLRTAAGRLPSRWAAVSPWGSPWSGARSLRSAALSWSHDGRFNPDLTFSKEENADPGCRHARCSSLKPKPEFATLDASRHLPSGTLQRPCCPRPEAPLRDGQAPADARSSPRRRQ